MAHGNFCWRGTCRNYIQDWRVENLSPAIAHKVELFCQYSLHGGVFELIYRKDGIVVICKFMEFQLRRLHECFMELTWPMWKLVTKIVELLWKAAVLMLVLFVETTDKMANLMRNWLELQRRWLIFLWKYVGTTVQMADLWMFGTTANMALMLWEFVVTRVKMGVWWKCTEISWNVLEENYG